MRMVAVVAVILTGCELVTGPDEVIGLVRAVEVPETVTAGQPFTVTVRTSGPSLCWRRERTDVEVRGRTATITPIDVEDRGPGEQCPAALAEITHTATVVFSLPGPARVVVRGRDDTGGEFPVAVD